MSLKEREKKAGKEFVPGLFCAGDTSDGWTIDKPMPAISTGNWMVSSDYLASVSSARYLGRARSGYLLNGLTGPLPLCIQLGKCHRRPAKHERGD